ncbi:hypothetical protein GCM10009087_20230 [Sphingomonas oligophenolica]
MGLGFLGIVVTRNEAPGCGTGKRMASPDIVAGNSAYDRTSDATFGEHRGGDDA